MTPLLLALVLLFPARAESPCPLLYRELGRTGNYVLESAPLTGLQSVYAHYKGGRWAEVGAADRPLCSGCVQIDRYPNRFELLRERVSEKMGKRASDAEVRAEYPGFFDPGKPAAVDPYQVFEAGKKGGVIAEAASIPDSVGPLSLILTRNFPWFDKAARKESIAPILKRYHELLEPGGAVVMLYESRGGGTDWTLHLEEAARLGFKSRPVAIPESGASGYLLVKE